MEYVRTWLFIAFLMGVLLFLLLMIGTSKKPSKEEATPDHPDLVEMSSSPSTTTEVMDSVKGNFRCFSGALYMLDSSGQPQRIYAGDLSHYLTCP